MPIRPTGYPDWANNGASSITQPSSTKQGVGWGVNEKPASQYMNWLQSLDSQWIRYLDWEAIVEDDFTFPSDVGAGGGLTGISGPSGLGIYWQTSARALWFDDSDMGAAGIARLNSLAGDSDSMYRWVGALGNRDWQLQMVGRLRMRGNSGSSIAIGMPGYGAAFQATGASGLWGFQFYPSGNATPTSVALGVESYQPTNYQHFRAERQGATMYVFIGPTLYLTMPGVAPAAGHLGITQNSVGSGYRTCFHLDKISLKVRRDNTTG